MTAQQPMPIRRSQRHDVAMRGRFSVAHDHESHVRLTRVSSASDGWVESDVVDLSGGGLGLLTPIYLPKRLLMTCEIIDPRSGRTLVHCSGRITRVVMTDRRPMYLTGLLFEEITPENREKLSELLAALADMEDAA